MRPAAPARSPVMVGTTVAHYRVLSLLGRGGMGEVYLAEDETLGRKVVLKVLPPAFVADEDRRRRFEREARAVAALNHPNIVTLYGVERAGDTLLLAMEFVDGRTLAQLIPRAGLPVDQLVPIALALAEAVGVAHRHGVVHRDLKPDNVMLTKDNRVKVLDFGLAKPLDQRRDPGLDQGAADAGALPTRTVSATELGVVLGTPHYMSPEQAQGLPVDHRTDIFSLGVVLYEMAAGVRPFGGETSVAVLSAILRDTPRPLHEVRPELPAPLVRLVERCLQKAPDRRFQDAFDLRNELAELAAAPPPGPSATPAAPVAPASPTAGPRAAVSRRRRAIAAASVLAVVALLAGALWVSRPRTPEVPLDPDRVAVAAIANQTGDASIDVLGPLASTSVAQLLRREGIGAVVATAEGSRVATEVAAREQARRLGAGLALFGDLAFAGNDLVFRGRFVNVVTGEDLRPLTPVTAARTTPNAIVPLIEQQLLGAVLFTLRGGGGMTGFSRETLSTLEAPSYDAYKEFSAGVENFGTNMREASNHFQKALDLDGRIWWSVGWLVPAYENLGEFDKAEEVLRKVRRVAPPRAKPTLDYLKARLDGRLIDSYTAAGIVRTNYPGHLPTATIAAWSARDVGRPQEMLDALLPITPDPAVNAAAWRGWTEQVAQAYHMLGRYEEERSVGERALAAVPGSALGLLLEARALAALGRVGELEKVLEACLSVPPSARPRPGLIIVTAAAELRAHGHREDSEKVAAQALRWLDGLDTALASSVPVSWLRGDALGLQGRWSEASAVYAKVAAAVPASTGARSEIGVIAAARGDVAAARRADAALATMSRPYIRGAHTFGRARIAAALGDRDRTVDLLREAFAEGQPVAWPTHADPAFERVRGYPPFDQLTALNRQP